MSITWSTIDAVHVDDADAHWRAAMALGLSCPFDIFEQLFHDHHRDQDFAATVAVVD